MIWYAMNGDVSVCHFYGIYPCRFCGDVFLCRGLCLCFGLCLYSFPSLYSCPCPFHAFPCPFSPFPCFCAASRGHVFDAFQSLRPLPHHHAFVSSVEAPPRLHFPKLR